MPGQGPGAEGLVSRPVQEEETVCGLSVMPTLSCHRARVAPRAITSGLPLAAAFGHDHGMTLVSRTLIAAVSGLALAGMSLQIASAAGSAVPTTSDAAQKAGGPRYRAIIRTTEHGIPHITAHGWGGLGFGSGY